MVHESPFVERQNTRWIIWQTHYGDNKAHTQQQQKMGCN